MAQVLSRSQRLAVLCLLVITFGGVAVVVGEAVSPLWPLLVIGAGGCLIGIFGLCILVYRISRESGDSFLTSLGRTLRAAIQVISDLP
jgi:hypothetical protein